MITLGIISLIVLGRIAQIGDSVDDAFDIILLVVVLFVAFAIIGVLVEYLVNRRNRDR
jgi:branched-subunit amino acid ABC-type transport system permease component